MTDPAPEPLAPRLVPLRSIRPTERIVESHARSLAHEMRISGVWTHPLLLERSRHALLDGHHRLRAAVRLGLERVPAIVIDYDHPALRLESWRPNESFTREQVLAVAESGELLPIKSTRHLVDAPLPRCRVELAALETAGVDGEPVAPATPPPSRAQLLFAFYHELLQRAGLRSVTAQDVLTETAATLAPHPRLRQMLQIDPAMAALLPGVSCRVGLGRREHAPFRALRAELLLLPPALLERPAALACAARWGLEAVDVLRDGEPGAEALTGLLRFGATLVARLEPVSRDCVLACMPAVASEAFRSGWIGPPDETLLRWQASLLGIESEVPSFGRASRAGAGGEGSGQLAGDATSDELELPLETLLVAGGDSRLDCDGPGGLNRYGVPPRPRPEAVQFSSSTASAISEYGFLFCDLLRRDLLAAHRRERRDRQALGRALSRAVGAELLALLELGEGEADVLTCASGTDAELASTLLALAAAGDRAVTSLLVSPGESGRGVALAAAGRYFDDVTSDGRAVTRGAPVWPDARIEVREVAIRGAGTDPRRLEEIDAEYLALGRAALERGDHVVAHLLATSKTGLSAPSLPTLERLVALAPNRVDVVVDACQMRWRFAELGALVRRGWSVQISGSKFLTGPPFSGALVLPTAWRARADGVRAGLAAGPGTAHPVDWSPWWSEALGSDGGPDPSRAHLFRWFPAILEARLLSMLPEALLEHAFERFREAVRERIDASRHLDPIDIGGADGATLGQLTIVCFRVLGATADGSLEELDEPACRRVFEWLNVDLSGRLDGLSEDAAQCLGQPCHIGQPVNLVVEGQTRAVLRLVLGARFYTSVGHAGPGAIEAALESQVADAVRALDKLDLVAEHWERLGDAA